MTLLPTPSSCSARRAACSLLVVLVVLVGAAAIVVPAGAQSSDPPTTETTVTDPPPETTVTTEPPPVTVPTEPPPAVTSPPVTGPSGLPVVVPPTDPNAPPPPPEAPIPDPSPQVQVLLAKLHKLDVQHIADSAQAQLVAAEHDEDIATGQRDAAQQLRDQRRRELAAAAASAYVHGGLEDADALADPTSDTYLPAATSQLLAGDAMAKNVRLFHGASAQLASAQAALDGATARRNDAQHTVDTVGGLLQDADKAIAQARRPLKAGADVSPTVLGDTALTPEELTGWLKDRLIAGYVGNVDIGGLAQLFIDEGKAEQVRGDIAFAEAIVETGAFTSPLTTHNNFAGIGACDTCADGWYFDTPQLGVRAQVQLLHAYADKSLQTNQLANDPVGGSPDVLSVRGCCETWNRLTGTWATDPNYGPKLMTVYESMLQWAFDHRSAPPAPAPPLPSFGR